MDHRVWTRKIAPVLHRGTNPGVREIVRPRPGLFWGQVSGGGWLPSRPVRTVLRIGTLLAYAWAPGAAWASFLSGAALDSVADVLAIVVLIVVPIAAIVAFWLVHILPEKVAEKRHHPQKEAIKTLCLLS